MIEQSNQFVEISANLTREDRAYLEKIDAQLLALLDGKHVREVEDSKKLEKIWDLVKARGAYLRATADERNELRESDFEQVFGPQYEKQIGYLKEAGFVDDNGKIVGALDKGMYLLPAKADVMAYLENKRALLEFKMKQGFTRLLLVPIGMQLNKMVELTGNVLLQQQEKKALKYPGGALVPDYDFNDETPIHFIDWGFSDVFEDCIYYAKRFESDDHGGKTKKELLALQQTTEGDIPGWEILVTEDTAVLPKIDGGRARIPVNKTADQYRAMLRDDVQYRGEKGLTNETWLTQLLVSVLETGEVLDDWQGSGVSNISLGSYLPKIGHSAERGGVSWSGWSRVYRQASLRWSHPDVPGPSAGIRTAV